MDGKTRMEVDKVDMSLDDIIKLEKKQKSGNNRGRGRGQRAGRGGGAGRGSRGRGRTNQRGGSAQNSNRGGVKGRGPNRYSQLNNNFRGRGRGTRGGSSPLNRTQSPGKGAGKQNKINTQIVVNSRGRRGRGGTLRGRGRGQLRGGLQNNNPTQQTVGLTSLKKRRELALQSLVKAKKTLAQIDAQQRQKDSRSLAVNKKRGLQMSNISLNKQSRRGQGRGRGGLSRYSSTVSLNSVASTKSRGRGRARGLNRFASNMSINSVGSPKSQGRGRARGLNRFASNLSINSVASTKSQGRGRGRGRGLSRFGSTVSLNSVGSQKKRGWRQKVTADDSTLTVSIPNSPQPQRPRKNKLKRYNVNDTDPVLAAQIKNLKPAVSQKYNFKKAVFAQAATSTSLNDRFSSGARNEGSDGLGRKVFF